MSKYSILCRYFHKDNDAIMWKLYTNMMPRGLSLSDSCTLDHLGSTLGGRPVWKKLHPLLYTFLSRFSLSINVHENGLVNIDGIWKWSFGKKIQLEIFLTIGVRGLRPLFETGWGNIILMDIGEHKIKSNFFLEK